MTNKKLLTMGDRVMWARETLGLHACDLEEFAKLAQGTVRYIERDGRVPKADNVLSLARVLGVTVEWLVDGSGEDPTPEQLAVAVVKARAAFRAGKGTESCIAAALAAGIPVKGVR